VVLSPDEIDVTDITQSKKFFITHDEQVVLPAEITKIVSGVFKTGNAVPSRVSTKTHFSDYSYMFKFELGDDGSITLTPEKDLLQVGVYEVFVHTIYGTATGVINAGLKDSHPAIPHHPVKTSRVTSHGQQADYLYGQVVSVELSADKKNDYAWFLDGKTHSSGPGMTSFRAWPEVGIHEVSSIARNMDGTVVSTWSDSITIAKEESIRISTQRGKNVSFKAPNGYTQATWVFDGKLVSEHQLDRSDNDTQEIFFDNTGTHILSCKVQGSENGNFRLITWSVDVK